MPRKPEFRQTFWTPFEEYHERIGQSFEVLRRATQKDGVDREVGRMWVIRFADGHTTQAWPEEVEVKVAAQVQHNLGMEPC